MTAWTEEMDKALTTMWATDMPASKIAPAIGGGITRNAVIGRAHRMKLPRRGRSGNREPKRRAAVITAVPSRRFTARLVNPPVELIRSLGRGIPLSRLGRGHCRAIIGIGDDPNGSTRYCGEPAASGSWCKFHAGIYLDQTQRK